MRGGSLASLLEYGRNWLWLQSVLAFWRRAALLGLLLGLLLLAAHVLVQAQPLQLAAGAAVLPLVAAAARAARLRPTRSAAARWLDVQLRAQAAFCTHLEFVAERSSHASPRALQSFAAWSADMTQRLGAQQRELPPLRAGRTVAFQLLALVPAAAIVALPGRQSASTMLAASSVAPVLVAGNREEAANRSVLAALRGGHDDRVTRSPGTQPRAINVGGDPQAAEIAPDNADAVASAMTPQGSTRVDGAGSGAGSNGASATRRPTAVAAPALQARFRELTGNPRAGAGVASGEAVAIVISANTPDTAQFDRQQSLLAGRVAAAQFDQNLQREQHGPAQTALLNRFSKLRDMK